MRSGNHSNVLDMLSELWSTTTDRQQSVCCVGLKSKTQMRQQNSFFFP